ncbi:MAG: OmpA family protein [Gammaproteobacteria bacterium]
MYTLDRVGRHAFVVVGILALLGPCLAQAQQDALFATTDELIKTAMSLDARLLSPKNYAKADAAYAKAKEYAELGRTDKAQKELVVVQSALKEAIETSKLGAVNFSTTLKTRNIALEAEAPKYEDGLWQRAEKQFDGAARALESGNVKSASDKARIATGYYSDAELAAIKTAIVGEARKLIAAADEDKVSREAPDSLNRAKALVAEAEAGVDKNRYQTEGPIALAAEAEYEARHAAYLASQVRRLKDKDFSAEQLILEWEKPLQDVARALDVTTDLSEGAAKSAAASVSMAESLVKTNAAMESRVAELETKLGGTERIAQESLRLQRQLKQVEALFLPSQARVVREGNDLVLRLVGLSFQTGQSVIESQYFGLLKKVQEAIEIFPDSVIGIEGHTDSIGSDATNMKLSQDRASSVREYLIANLGLPESRVTAVGYGASRPIASDTTDAGRAQNRRIDVVIRNARVRDGS